MSTLTSPTLGKLITNIRNLLGQPSAINSTWTDDELREYINEAIRMYFTQVVKNYEGHFSVTTDPTSGGSGNLTYTAGTDLVALPIDCFSVRAVYIQRPQGWSLLEYKNDITHGYWTNVGNGDPNIYQPYYFFQGNNLVLRPVPNLTSLNALKVDYTQMPDQLINGGDSMTAHISPVFKQVIEAYAIWMAKSKQSMVNGVDLTAIAQKRLDAAVIQLKDTITPRSAYPRFTEPFNPEIY